ncbi:MAG TPA: hypothetical protein PKC28_09120, partial [Bdellovibrionales bacterium]|nr:hypothetical protein [Bdellovibrionales bacterium]
MKFKYAVPLAIFFACTVIFGAFQNCAEDVSIPEDSDVSSNSSSSSSSSSGSSSSSSGSATQPLLIIIPSPTMAAGSSMLLRAEGGVAPYVFSVVSGGATVSVDYLTAGSAAGLVTARV